MVPPASATLNSPLLDAALENGASQSGDRLNLDVDYLDAFGDHAAALVSLPQSARNTVTPDLLSRCALMSADVVAAAIALLALVSISSSITTSLSDSLAILLIIPVCTVLGLYDRDSDVLNKTTLQEMPRLLCAAMTVTLATITMRNVLTGGEHQITAEQLALMSLTMFGALGATRLAARSLVRRCVSPERILAIGSESDCERLSNAIASTAGIKATIAGHVSTAEPSGVNGLPRAIDAPDKLQMMLNGLDIDRVVIATDSGGAARVDGLIRAISATGAKVSLQPRLFGSTRAVPVIESIGSVKLVNLRKPRLSPAAQRTKRVVDFCGAAFALILASPILAAIAVSIKLDSRGPVFYRQKRIGLNGKPFEIIKFRTMEIDAESKKQRLMHLNETDGLFKISADPRITRVGKLLRKSSFDELPQLINVVRGDMSLVGPRPLVPEEDRLITGWRRHRNTITPGMTGVWQLLGPVRIPIDEMVEIDYEYVANWSLGTDIRILFQTVPHVLARRGL